MLVQEGVRECEANRDESPHSCVGNGLGKPVETTVSPLFSAPVNPWEQPIFIIDKICHAERSEGPDFRRQCHKR